MHKYYNADTCHNKPAKLTRPGQEYTDPDYIPPKVSRPSKPLASPPSVSVLEIDKQTTGISYDSDVCKQIGTK
jgi:hypothetical protein